MIFVIIQTFTCTHTYKTPETSHRGARRQIRAANKGILTLTKFMNHIRRQCNKRRMESLICRYMSFLIKELYLGLGSLCLLPKKPNPARLTFLEQTPSKAAAPRFDNPPGSTSLGS